MACLSTASTGLPESSGSPFIAGAKMYKCLIYQFRFLNVGPFSCPFISVLGFSHDDPACFMATLCLDGRLDERF
jgi:hypothetical protein